MNKSQIKLEDKIKLVFGMSHPITRYLLFDEVEPFRKFVKETPGLFFGPAVISTHWKESRDD